MTTIQIPGYTHAILSPSKAAMWLSCTGAIGMTKDMPNKPSSYAAEGTAYHDVCRRALIEGKDCAAYIGDQYEVEGFHFTVDPDNAEAAQRYVDQVRALPGKRFVEVELEYSRMLGIPKTIEVNGVTVPVAAGTGDCVSIDYENKVIYGLDLKFGRGEIVYALENPQVRLYMAAAVEKYELLGITDDWKAVGGISQPRIGHYDTETLTVGELKAWVAAQRPAANRAYVLYTWGPERIGITDLAPGEKQCRWCPITGSCKAKSQRILDKFPTGHAAAAVPLLTKLDDVEVAEALDLADEIDHWLSSVRAEALQRALQGRTIPNWKLVEGRRGNRQLNENARVTLDVAALTEIGIQEAEESSAMPIADALDFALGSAAYKPKELLTVAKLQKPLEKKAPLLWAAMQAHISQSEGRPALERIADPRPPLVNVSQEFPTVEGGKANGLL